MLSPVLIISGPTASGKTSLAIELMKLLNGELVSADSRQIYKGFDIGTGKDHPKNIKIHMIDILNPKDQYSVTQYRQTVLKLIKNIQSKGKLPIIVGGTGQYIQSLIEFSRETFHIKPNKFLRFFLNKLAVKYLQKIYKFLDKEKYNKLNNSDIHNPHRLIRKIEISLSQIPMGLPRRSAPRNDVIASVKRSNLKGIKNYIHISLTAPNSYLFKNIDQRVDERIKMGLFNEIRDLLKKYSWSAPAFRTHAYKEFRNVIARSPSFFSRVIARSPSFFSRVIARSPSPADDEAIPMETIRQWHYDEHRYVHRQKTWFRKMPNVHFFDITSDKYPQDAIGFVLKCYNKL